MRPVCPFFFFPPHPSRWGLRCGVVVVVVVCYYQISKKRHYYSFQEWNVEKGEPPKSPKKKVVPAPTHHTTNQLWEKNNYSVRTYYQRNGVMYYYQINRRPSYYGSHPIPTLGLTDCFPNPKAKMKCEVSDLAKMG